MSKEIAVAKKQKVPSTDEYAEYLEELSQFEDSFYEHLAGTNRLQIVPLQDEEGEYLTEEALVAIKSECYKLGYTIIYQITKNNNDILFFCPTSKKLGVVCDGIH